MASIEAGLRDALSNFKKKLTPEEEVKFASVTLKDLKVAITALQDDQKRSKTVRNLTKIQPFLHCMSQYQTIIEVFLNTSDILCFVWGPLKFLLLVSCLPNVGSLVWFNNLQIAKNLSTAFDVILDTYQKFAEEFPLIEQYRTLFKESEYTHSFYVIHLPRDCQRSTHISVC